VHVAIASYLLAFCVYEPLIYVKSRVNVNNPCRDVLSILLRTDNVINNNNQQNIVNNIVQGGGGGNGLNSGGSSGGGGGGNNGGSNGGGAPSNGGGSGNGGWASIAPTLPAPEPAPVPPPVKCEVFVPKHAMDKDKTCSTALKTYTQVS